MKYVLIPLLPFAAFVVIGLFGHWIKERAHWIAVPAVAASFLLALSTCDDIAHGNPIHVTLYSWIASGAFDVSIGLYIDRLTAAMLLLVTIVSGLVHVYTIGYMHGEPADDGDQQQHRDRKSTRLNSSHSQISYAVFCLKKKNQTAR